MKSFPKETWSYAILLIVLFAIATIAVWHTISYLEDRITTEEFGVVAVLLWSLTLGFMLIAGAFGLWAIQFSAEAESRRRIGRLVDTMDYLSDGLLSVDRKGRILASNPAIRDMVNAVLARHESLREVFTCLNDDDVTLLLNKDKPNEVQRELTTAAESRTFRFRSQPSEGPNLILVSDVTVMNNEMQHRRRVARLQLIGQMARGVAHDFNNLLCGISAHASVLTRVQAGSPEMSSCINAVTLGAEKGISLAGHLLELTRPSLAGQSTDMIGEHVNRAAQMLRDSISPDWHVETKIQDPFGAIALTGIQVEQVVMNLGLLVADAVTPASVISVNAARPDSTKPLLNVGSRYAGVILIAGGPLAPETSREELFAQKSSRDSGVIQSVIRSMLVEAGGALDCLKSTAGLPLYRVALPRGKVIAAKELAAALPQELKAYISNWSVLLAASRKTHLALEKRMNDLGINIQRVDTIVSALTRIEEIDDLDAMVLDTYLLGQESKGLLRAILKLRPSAGTVVLCDDPESQPEELSGDLVFVHARSAPDKILASMIEAKSLAARRKAPQAT